MNIFQGDVKLSMTENGTEIVFVGGQPIMDQGLENLALISLFTRKGWPGNTLFPEDDQKIGSDFEIEVEKPITITSINNIEKAAKKALENPAFGEVFVDVTNPINYRLDIDIRINPPASSPVALLLTRNGQNWILQSADPAYRRV